MYNEPLKEKVYKKLETLTEIYGKKIFVPCGEAENVQYFDCGAEHLRLPPVDGLQPASKGDKWGGEWQNRWFLCTVKVPAAAQGKKLYAVSACGGVEQMLFINGKPMGLYNSKNDFVGGNHAALLICDNANAGDEFELAFECYAGHFCVDCHPFDNYGYPDIAEKDYMHTFNGIQLCYMDEEIKDFVFDVRELLTAREVLPKNNFARTRALRVLDKVADCVVFYPLHYSDEEIHEGVRKALVHTRAFFEKGGNSRTFGRVGIIGHSHMDTAWLWPVDETIRKCARTYCNAMSLMRQYPEYKFIQSSALHCEWMKKYYPAIFEDMKKFVAEGRYEPNGGVYVECDCNVTSGEFMIRQFLKGQLFTREHFGYTSDSFWLPDTFGYNGNIPQIMKGCDVDYFYTTKIGWNEMNHFPFESFKWKGIDGSEVLTHFNITHCFPDVDDITRAVNGITLKESSDMRLVAYGYGDGGGGPTYGMIESARRAGSMEGMPEIENMTISAFMKELEQETEYLPVYDGELYLELHRGTLTQMHDVKRKNRKAEFAVRDMEYFNVAADQPCCAKADEWTKILLKNQFHDILPGTCITPVYTHYNTEMDQLIADLNGQALSYAQMLTDGDAAKVTLFNTLSFARDDVAVIEGAKGYAADLPSQKYTDVCGRECLAVAVGSVDGFASKTIALTDSAPENTSVFKYDGETLETPFAVIRFGKDGYIESFIDKNSGRELRKANGAPLNCLLFGEDVPNIWDNWDLETDVVDRLQIVNGFVGREVVSDGCVEMRLRSTFKIGNSNLTQDMVVYAADARVDFHTLVNWNSPHSLLKVGFDLDIRTQNAKNEIQYGHVERPTTKNNSLEVAKFEVCNYKWTDVSENRFGVALLNDCKYGITVSDAYLRLSLHRGGTHPDVTGDKGVHEMTYSLLPHDGSFSADSVVKPSYELNVPYVCVQGKATSNEAFLQIGGDSSIICEAVKPAELIENAYVIRLYECERTAASASIKLSRPCKKAWIANMLEDKKEELSVNGNEITLTFRPFEIKTLLIEE